jgi:hypothetical protein
MDNIARCAGHFHIIKGGVFVANIIKRKPPKRTQITTYQPQKENGTEVTSAPDWRGIFGLPSR